MRREADYRGSKRSKEKGQNDGRRVTQRQRGERRAGRNEEAPGTKPGNGEHAEIRGAMDLEALNRFQ